MSAKVYRDAEGCYRGWLTAHPHGYVVNARREPDPEYLVLHRATCGSISTHERENYTTASYIKICADQTSDLERWARDEVGGPLKHCGLCKP